MANLGWKSVPQHRVAWLGDSGVYHQKVFTGANLTFSPEDLIPWLARYHSELYSV
ncbi:hypothetical protein [Stenotrophomonas phage CM2]